MEGGESMNLFKNISISFSTISAAFAIIIIIVQYIMNMPYTAVIEKKLGIEKNNKGQSIMMIIMLFVFFIITFPIIAIILDDNTSSIAGTSDNKQLLYLITFIIVSIFSMCNLYEFEKNVKKYISRAPGVKSQTYYIVIAYTCSIIFMFFNVWSLFHFILKSKENNDVSWVITNLVIFIIVLIHIIINYTLFITKGKLVGLENRILYSNDKQLPVMDCKIIYSNDQYICVYYENNIIHINKSEVKKIESTEL